MLVERAPTPGPPFERPSSFATRGGRMWGGDAEEKDDFEKATKGTTCCFSDLNVMELKIFSFLERYF